MHKLIWSGLAAASALTLAAPAMAQDIERAPFTGLYVGGSFGWSVQPNDIGENVRFDRDLNGTFGDTVTTATGANAFSPGFCNGRANGATRDAGCRNDKNGLDYYGRVGFDIQRGHLVGGVIGEFGQARINDSVSAFSTTPASYTLTRALDWEASARVRGGYVAGNSTLFYATGGAGYAKLHNIFRTTNAMNGFQSNGDDKVWGVVGGGGIETKLTKHISVGMEYMFHRYKDDDYRVRVTRGIAAATNPFVLSPNTTGTDLRRGYDYFRWHSLRGTVAFRF